MAGGSLPDPRWRDRGPEVASKEGHLDLRRAGPPRGGPCPSAQRSPRAFGPQPQAPPDVRPPAPPPGPARRLPAPRGLLCQPLTRQALAGRSRSLPRPGSGPLALTRSPSHLLPQLPTGRPATRGAVRGLTPLRCAYLRSGGSGLSGGYGGGCSVRNRASGGAEGGAAQTAAAQTRPDPARPAPRAPPPGPSRDTARAPTGFASSA